MELKYHYTTICVIVHTHKPELEAMDRKENLNMGIAEKIHPSGKTLVI